MSPPPEEDIAAALDALTRYAERIARGPAAAHLDALLDAATDAVLWATRKHNPAAGPFVGFAATVGRRAVDLRFRRLRRRDARRPAVGPLDDLNPFAPPTRADRPDVDPFAPLPAHLAAAARRVWGEGLSQQAAAADLGISPAALSRRLSRAAALLAPLLARPA